MSRLHFVMYYRSKRTNSWVVRRGWRKLGNVAWRGSRYVFTPNSRDIHLAPLELQEIASFVIVRQAAHDGPTEQ
jgi:hypothetical protein